MMLMASGVRFSQGDDFARNHFQRAAAFHETADHGSGNDHDPDASDRVAEPGTEQIQRVQNAIPVTYAENESAQQQNRQRMDFPYRSNDDNGRNDRSQQDNRHG